MYLILFCSLRYTEKRSTSIEKENLHENKKKKTKRNLIDICVYSFCCSLTSDIFSV